MAILLGAPFLVDPAYVSRRWYLACKIDEGCTNPEFNPLRGWDSMGAVTMGFTHGYSHYTPPGLGTGELFSMAFVKIYLSLHSKLNGIDVHVHGRRGH